ncbi:unnamed protein product, partial [Durusdinium trenchii]
MEALVIEDEDSENACILEVQEVWDGRDVGWSTHVNVRSWKCWRSAALGLAALLSGAALLIIMHCFAPTETRQMDTAASTEEWEDFVKAFPNASTVEDWGARIESTIARAKGLQLDRPLRSLRDVFYADISEESGDYPYIRTECVIDTVQATTYLMEAIVVLFRAIDQRGKRCADSDVGCAINVIGFITCVTWVSAYLSLAASACSSAVNSGALCSADWTTLVAAFGEIATAGAGVRYDCNIPSKLERAFGYGITTTKRPYLKYFPPGGALPALDTVYKFKLLSRSRKYRKFDITACVADVFQAAAFLIRSLLQIRDAAQSCPNPRNCAINILNVISSFAWISHFSVQAVDDCAKAGSQEARCGAEISGLIAAMSMTPAAGYATTSVFGCCWIHGPRPGRWCPP